MTSVGEPGPAGTDASQLTCRALGMCWALPLASFAMTSPLPDIGADSSRSWSSPTS